MAEDGKKEEKMVFPPGSLGAILQDTGDSRSATLTARISALPTEAPSKAIPFLRDLSDAVHPSGPYGDNTRQVTQLLCDSGAAECAVSLIGGGRGGSGSAPTRPASLDVEGIPYLAATMIRSLCLADDMVALRMYDIGAPAALLALASARGSLATERHAALCALSVLFVSAAPMLRERGVEGGAATWGTLLDLTRFSGQSLADEVSRPEGSRGVSQIELVTPKGKLADAVAYAPRFEGMVREAAVQAIASMAVAIADVDRERLALLEGPHCARLIDTIASVAGSPLPAAHPNSSIRYQAALAAACLCHVPPQLDPFAETPTSRAVAALRRAGIVRALSACMRELTRTGLTSPGEDILAPLRSAEERVAREAELRHIDTLLFVTNCFANLSSFKDTALDMSASAAPVLAEVIRGNAALFSRDEERIEQSNAHFKTVGCTTRALPFHVTHFAPSSYYNALIALSNISEYGGTVPPDTAGAAVRDARAAAAKVCKECGNELFKLGDFESALWRYTKAARLHPDDDERLAIFFSNRAECFLQMELFPEAFTDTETALSINPAHEKSVSRRERAREGMAEDEERRKKAEREGTRVTDPPTGAPPRMPDPSRGPAGSGPGHAQGPPRDY